MARGRFISKEISIDKKVNSLSSPWSMLAFTWLLTHADREGRTYGDPIIVRSMIFPRQVSVSTEEMELYIKEWVVAGLVNWYEVDGEKYIEFPNFPKHQVGLRKDKEPRSIIPDNPNNLPESDGGNTEDLRNNGGCFPAEVKLSRSKVEEEVEEEVEGEEEVEVEKHDDVSLSSSFSKVSGLEIPTSEGEMRDWNDALSRLRAMGVNQAIMKRACNELTEKKYRITSPKSILKACEMIMAEKFRQSQGGFMPVGTNSDFYSAITH